MRFKSLLYILFVILITSNANAITIEFEALPTSPEYGVIFNTYVEDGFEISLIGGTFIASAQDGWQSGRGSSNGTTTVYVFADSFVSPTVQIKHSIGELFGLSSIDFAELLKPTDSGFSYIANSIEITGYKSGGEVLVENILLDNLNDGPGGAIDFQTLIFNPDWLDLTHVLLKGINDIQYTYFNFDNISLTLVPIPSAVWLFGSGLIGLVGVARRK